MEDEIREIVVEETVEMLNQVIQRLSEGNIGKQEQKRELQALINGIIEQNES